MSPSRIRVSASHHPDSSIMFDLPALLLALEVDYSVARDSNCLSEGVRICACDNRVETSEF